MPTIEKLQTVFIIYLLLAVTTIIYLFGLSGPLLLDDFENLKPLGDYGGVISGDNALRFIFGNNSGPLGRPVSMAAFLLDDFSWPTYSVSTFKLTNVALHLVVGLVLFLVVLRTFTHEFAIGKRKANTLGLIIFALWLLHPIHVSTVLYVIQRMAILSTLFSLCAFLFYLRFRFYMKNGQGRQVLLSICLFSLFFLLAIFAKENALLVLPFVLICELFIFKSVFSEKVTAKVALCIYIVILTSPLWLYWSYELWGRSYTVREFNLQDRLTLQLSVVGDYIGKILLPTADRMNLFNERYTASAISLQNNSFLSGLFFSLFFVVVFVLAYVKKNQIIVFGLTWFVCFHLLESTILPLEIYFEHRNYMPSIGLLIAFVAGIHSFISKKCSIGIFVLCFSLFIIYQAFISTILTNTWGNTSSLFIKFTSDEPSSIRAKVTYASFLENRGLPEFAISEIVEAIDKKPEMISLQLNKIRLMCQYDLGGDMHAELDRLNETDLFDTAAVFQLRQLMKIEHDCVMLNAKQMIIDNAISKISSTDDFAIRSTVGSQFYFLVTDWYISKRLFTPALDSIDKAISYAPTVDLYLKKIVLLTSAGLYREALKVIPLALFADEKRSFLEPTRSKEIIFLQQSLENQIKKNSEPIQSRP